jgi:small subunit ribosomal protein S1
VHLGKTYRFRIIEYKDSGRSIVVSRRKQLEEEQQADAAAVRKSIVPGALLRGRVVSVPDFGAFVDLGGGIQGLLHVSDMSWTRAATPGAVVAPGDQITVTVLRVDEGTGKISLGLKQLQDDPRSLGVALVEDGSSRAAETTASPDAASAMPIGSLADKLRDALKGR